MPAESFPTREAVDVENTPIAELVAEQPHLEAVLKSFGLDTCCGGAYSPTEAATKHGFDPAPLLAALRQALAS